jgi:hypothetical protein
MSSSSLSFIQFEILDRIVDTEYGLTTYPRRSSLAGYQCQCAFLSHPTVVPWRNVPFLWGYAVLPMPSLPFQPPPLAFPWFDHFRDCYTSKTTYAASITVQSIAFQNLTPYSEHTEEILLDNCFEDDRTAKLYTIQLPDHPPTVLLYRHSDLFEVKINYNP